MIIFVGGFALGVLMVLATAGWLQSGKAAESVPTQVMIDCLKAGCTTTLDNSPMPTVRLDAAGIMNAAISPSGKARVIQSDEDGYVICSPHKK